MAKNPLQNFVVRYAGGQPVFQEGDVGATMYIVQSGRVRLYRDVEGARTLLGELEKGDFFGEMSILEGLPRTSSAEASENSELIEINSSTFDKMIRGNIEIAIRMLRKLSIRLRESERLLTENAAARVAATAKDATASAAKSASRVRAESNDVSGVRLESSENGAKFALDRLETLIGRYDPVTEQSPDIDLTDLDLKRSVSRRHARIRKGANGYALIEEVGALNGTFVNGTKIDAGQAHRISDGDELSIGMVKIIFREPVNRFLAGLTLSVSCCFPGAAAADHPASYDLRVSLDFSQAAGDEGLREEFELQLVSELRRSACFRSVEMATRVPENEPASGTRELQLRIVVDEIFEETVYDTSIAERADPAAPESLELAQTSRFRTVVSASLEHPPTRRTLRSRRIRGAGAHRPLTFGEDARHIALREACLETASSVRIFLCKGGEKRLRKEIASADAR